MPEWLLKRDNYVPESDKDSFIDKSILSFLNVLSKFNLQRKNEISHSGSNALVKLISAFIFILFLSLSKNFFFVLLVNASLLVFINFLEIDKIKYILKGGLIAAFFSFIVLLPSVFLGYGSNTFMITLKVFASVTAVNVLACTTNWSSMVSALKVFHIPDMFILIFDVALKYIMILGDFSLNMIYALKLRSVGKNRDKSSSISGIMGTMFIRSREMSEEMYEAMECRGFTGKYRSSEKLELKLPEYICIISDIMYLAAYFYLNR